MELFSWISYPSEYRYLTVVFGCLQTPSLETLTLLRQYTISFHRYPNIEEFLLFVSKECDSECEYFLPLPDLIDATRFSLIQYGFVPRCRLAYFMYNFRIFENRYPTSREIFHYLQSLTSPSDNWSRLANEIMERDTADYWEKKQSGLTEQDIYKLVQTNEEKDLVCCVCQDEIAQHELVVRLPCNHSFHRGAEYKLAPEDRLTTPTNESDCQGVEEWLKRSGTCPVCRLAITKN